MATWMDFSGAPALLIPVRLREFWTGVNTPDWDDYDRACELAWPGKGIIQIGDSTGYVLYSESDTHAWIESANLYASGGWEPNAGQVKSACWEDRVVWSARENDYMLVNSAEDLRGDMSTVDHQLVSLVPGKYEILYAEILGEYWGQFHKFTFLS